MFFFFFLIYFPSCFCTLAGSPETHPSDHLRPDHRKRLWSAHSLQDAGVPKIWRIQRLHLHRSDWDSQQRWANGGSFVEPLVSHFRVCCCDDGCRFMASFRVSLLTHPGSGVWGCWCSRAPCARCCVSTAKVGTNSSAGTQTYICSSIFVRTHLMWVT